MNFFRAFWVRGQSKRVFSSASNRSPRERLNHIRSRMRLLRFQHRRGMPSFTIHFDDSDTMPARLYARAKELDIPVDVLIQRAIVEHLGVYGLPPPDISREPANLKELFKAHGLLKSTPE